MLTCRSSDHRDSIVAIYCLQSSSKLEFRDLGRKCGRRQIKRAAKVIQCRRAALYGVNQAPLRHPS